jgi:hypothetical protein
MLSSGSFSRIVFHRSTQRDSFGTKFRNSHREEVKNKLSGIIAKADEMDNYFHDQFGCPSEYAKN